MAAFKPIRMRGLPEFNRALMRASELTTEARQEVSKEASQLAVAWAHGRIPKRTGRAARSVRVVRFGAVYGVQGGDEKTRYYPWLDFGGRTGKRKSVVRQYIDGGRYIYPGIAATAAQAQNVLEKAVADVISRSGLGG